MRRRGKMKVSYVKKPFAKRSFISLGVAVFALILGVSGLASAVITNGQIPLNMLSACFCSILLSLVSLGYGGLSFLEKDKKYILSKIGMGISGVLFLVWIILIIVGMRG